MSEKAEYQMRVNFCVNQCCVFLELVSTFVVICWELQAEGEVYRNSFVPRNNIQLSSVKGLEL